MTDMQIKPLARSGLWLPLLSAVILVAVGVVIAFSQDMLFRQQQFREVSVQAQVLAANMTAALEFNDTRTGQEYVNALKINPEIEAVGVFDAKGMLFARFTRAGARAMPRSIAEHDALLAGDRLTVSAPVVQRGARLGVVLMRTSEESFARRLTRYAPIVLLAIMAALLVAVLGAAQRTLNQANFQLEERARELADSNNRLQDEMQEREKAEDALRQSQKMEAVGQLSGGVAHDFNNLLAIIKGNLQLMQKRLAEGRDVQRYFAAAHEGIERAANLTKRLLAFSRRQALSPTLVDLSELVQGMRDLILHSVGEQVRLELMLDAQWKTICDANQMENVVLNLAINARDAMADGGTLTIETRDLHIDRLDGGQEGFVPGDHIELRVIDTGSGMSPDVLQRALDPFFTTKPQGQGTGLGLSMAFGFIRQSHGLMNIQSAPGRGTAVTILLPRRLRGEAQVAA